MSRYHEIKHRVATTFQRHVGNPILVRLPSQPVLETTGRRSGEPRRTPIGGRRVGRSFWIVSEFGEKSQYVRNIQADPRVRVRLKGRWHTGTARLLPEDDPRARLKTLPTVNSAAVRAIGTNLLTIRVDLDD
ncbi:deazaflavin-dependent oxidoreductase, nitroreductase family [Amycolatopsis lurida]|uniref:Nitroreductase n=1 Tax=Amycolatopsis lurida NRRL 2430 TaxID=1460371 RepID=A0A2P2G2R9_AMYLU|nr:nitroreductase/quinone reductase family protein [Amycolatopsis lurida]KFU83273.1 nitroreductase [Amycolatopsis lurida NRRL 2430]SED27057.1 deazaflavin-dependent oxidoreductase, nitroreductase family [Amycolatopsis lurida]